MNPTPGYADRGHGSQQLGVHMFCPLSGCCGPERSMVEVERGIWGLHWSGADVT